MEFELIPGNYYTVSLDMKSSVENYPVTLSMIAITNYRRRMTKIQKTFQVGTEWKKCSFTFRAFPKKDLPYYFMRFDNGAQLTEKNEFREPIVGALWLDNIQFAESKEDKDVARSGLLLSLNAGEKIILGKEGIGVAQVSLNIYNANSEAVDEAFVIQSKDPYGKLVNAVVTSKISLPPHSSHKSVYPVALNRQGAYRFFVKPVGSQPYESLYDTVALVSEVPALQTLTEYGYAVAQNGDLGWREFPYKSANVDMFKPGIFAQNSSPDEDFSRLSKMGCKLIRATTEFAWSDIEPEEGKFSFEHSDILVKLAEDNNIKIVPCLAGTQFMTRRWGKNIEIGLPQWLREKSNKSPYTPALRKYKQDFTYLPQMEYWRRYVRVLAERYKGKITRWEIMNEPNLILSAEDYVKYLKEAYVVLKEVDSANKILGFCATGDLGGNPDGFLAECLALGGMDYADIVSFHPYHAIALESAVSADQALGVLRNRLSGFSHSDVPLWNSELFFLKDNDATGAYEPKYYARRFLTDLGEGVGESMSIQTFNVLHPFEKYYESRVTECRNFPNGPFIVYNALAGLFTNAKPVGRIQWPADSICYVYENNGRYLAAVWAYGKHQKLELKLDTDLKNIRFLDMWGNPYAPKDGVVELTGDPLYMQWEKQAHEAVLKALGSADISGQNLFSVGAFRPVWSKDGWQGVIGIDNQSGKTLSGTLQINCQELEVNRTIEFSLAANSEDSLIFPITYSSCVPSQIPVTIDVDGKQCPLVIEKCFPFPKVYTVGNTEGKEIVLKSGSADSSAQFSMKMENGNLLFHVRVQDKTPSGEPNERASWQQDCVELMLDTDVEGSLNTNVLKHNQNIVRVFVLPYAKRKIDLWRRAFENLQIASDVQLTEDGYIVDLRIPLDKLNISRPFTGKCLGFEVLVHDAPGPKPDTFQMRWNSKGQAHKDRRQFGLLFIEG